MTFLVTVILTFFLLLFVVPMLMALAQFFCVFALVNECEAQVFLLFGKVVGVLSEPGLHVLPVAIGPQAFLIRFFGAVRRVDQRLDQEYLRSQPVNSEEGTPMGIGVWYEMKVGEPVNFLFRNTDPRGSLRANVRNAAVRNLNNMPLQRLLEDRHAMSRKVREDVSPKSESWGYRLGSVYIRKVHFRDSGMIAQIEQKVVNRLRQVTSAIVQEGANQVAVIKSSAERTAAVEFAKAGAVRPFIVGKAIHEVATDPEILDAVFQILETNKMLDGNVDLTLLPAEGEKLLAKLVAAQGTAKSHQAPVLPPPATLAPPGPTPPSISSE
jgi:regulator of protease activity HflC (stomatin/prohibitin superfamily)